MRAVIQAALFAVAVGGAKAADPHSLMPRIDDHAQMWWAEGFPSHTPNAPWLRCIQTGSYALSLNTETLRIPHFGAVKGGAGYGGYNSDWEKLPPAELGLGITVDGKAYRHAGGGKWTRFTGPRLIESGRFFQRADVTDLVFKADDGEALNVEARFETAAWSDRLGLILAVEPGLQPIRAGEASFGRVGGGFGLNGENHFEVPHRPELDPEKFTLEFWVFVPVDYRASERVWPWLVCKNSNEAADGNFGMMIVDGKAQARMNIGGGREGQVSVESRSLKLSEWNHLAMTYDGETLRVFLNGNPSGEEKIGRKRVPGDRGLAFGRRQDNSGDGYHFRGVVDEIRLYDRALSPDEIRRRFSKPEGESEAIGIWGFRADAKASMTAPQETWGDVELEIRLSTEGKELVQRSKSNEVFLAIDPVAFETEDGNAAVVVDAGKCPVDFDQARGWYRVKLDGIDPITPEGDLARKNDAIERIPFTLSNRTDEEQIARILFEKSGRGIRQRIGSPITGMSAILCDADGFPTGIPVQLSKNWHHHPEGGVYSGTWFHGITQVRVPAGSTINLELVIAYGHWGGVPAASHAQLSLIGWGSNQLWDQSALGAWGESICYDPDQVQANCTITDVRPLMVRSMGKEPQRGWTNNVGGGDFFRLFESGGERIAHTGMRVAYQSHGPCLTEVTYSGKLGVGIKHATTVSLARSDDIVRGTYRLRLDVEKATEFSRFVVFQIGADTYNSTRERKMAIGDEEGLVKEWDTRWGGDIYKMKPIEAKGRMPWVSLHEGNTTKGEIRGAIANRGIVIRAWKARIGGKETAPWIAERGLTKHRIDSSTLDIVPPPGVGRFEVGDFIEATIEQIVMPQFGGDYYGPNKQLRAALEKDENTWRMIFREAVGNDRKVKVTVGDLERMYPDVRVRADGDVADLILSGGLGYVPITFTTLSSNRGYRVLVDGAPLDQSVHGNDFWQTDYDAVRGTWSRTHNIPVGGKEALEIRLAPN